MWQCVSADVENRNNNSRAGAKLPVAVFGVVMVFTTIAAIVFWPAANGVSHFGKLVGELRRSTCPADATTTEAEIVQRETESTARWQMESTMTINELRNWIARNGPAGYVLAEHNDSTFTLRSTHPGEVRLLRFSNSERPNTIAVRCSVVPW